MGPSHIWWTRVGEVPPGRPLHFVTLFSARLSTGDLCFIC